MSVNKVILVGNLGKDPEAGQTGGGVTAAKFSLATSYKRRDGESFTEWHNIAVYGKLAEVCLKYLHKGKQIYIEGRIQYRSYDDRDGNKRHITEIVADQMQMLGGKVEGEKRETRPAQEEYADPPFDDGSDVPF